MKFYYIVEREVLKIPFEIYKNNVVILSLIEVFADRPIYEISLDFKDHSMYNNDMYLYNLTDEDILHLTLLGVILNEEYCDLMPELAEAIKNKRTNIALAEMQGMARLRL